MYVCCIVLRARYMTCVICKQVQYAHQARYLILGREIIMVVALSVNLKCRLS